MADVTIDSAFDVLMSIDRLTSSMRRLDEGMDEAAFAHLVDAYRGMAKRIYSGAKTDDAKKELQEGFARVVGKADWTLRGEVSPDDIAAVFAQEVGLAKEIKGLEAEIVKQGGKLEKLESDNGKGKSKPTSIPMSEEDWAEATWIFAKIKDETK